MHSPKIHSSASLRCVFRNKLGVIFPRGLSRRPCLGTLPAGCVKFGSVMEADYMMNSIPRFVLTIALLISLGAVMAWATTETVIYSFKGGSDGSGPSAGLVA